MIWSKLDPWEVLKRHMGLFNLLQQDVRRTGAPAHLHRQAWLRRRAPAA